MTDIYDNSQIQRFLDNSFTLTYFGYDSDWLEEAEPLNWSTEIKYHDALCQDNAIVVCIPKNFSDYASDMTVGESISVWKTLCNHSDHVHPCVILLGVPRSSTMDDISELLSYYGKTPRYWIDSKRGQRKAPYDRESVNVHLTDDDVIYMDVQSSEFTFYGTFTLEELNSIAMNLASTKVNVIAQRVGTTYSDGYMEGFDGDGDAQARKKNEIVEAFTFGYVKADELPQIEIMNDNDAGVLYRIGNNIMTQAENGDVAAQKCWDLIDRVYNSLAVYDKFFTKYDVQRGKSYWAGRAVDEAIAVGLSEMEKNGVKAAFESLKDGVDIDDVIA